MENKDNGFKANSLIGGLANLGKLTQSVASPELAPQEPSSETNDKTDPKPKAVKKSKVVDSTKNTETKKTMRQAAAKGCKEGYTRHTYILPIEITEHISNMAIYFGWTETKTVEQLLAKGIEDAIKKYGKEVVASNREKTLF